MILAWASPFKSLSMGMKWVLKHQDLQLFDFVAKHNLSGRK